VVLTNTYRQTLLAGCCFSAQPDWDKPTLRAKRSETVTGSGTIRPAPEAAASQGISFYIRI